MRVLPGVLAALYCALCRVPRVCHSLLLCGLRLFVPSVVVVTFGSRRALLAEYADKGDKAEPRRI